MNQIENDFTWKLLAFLGNFLVVFIFSFCWNLFKTNAFLFAIKLFLIIFDKLVFGLTKQIFQIFFLKEGGAYFNCTVLVKFANQ